MIEIKNNNYYNDLKDYFSIKSYLSENEKFSETRIYKKYLDQILDIGNTILIIKNRKEFTDSDFFIFDCPENKIDYYLELKRSEEWSRDSLSLHSIELENMNIGCDSNINLFIFKFDNINDLSGFIKSININIKIEIYTTLESEKKIDVRTIIIDNSIIDSYKNNENSFNDKK